jgi:hypothetical protein
MSSNVQSAAFSTLALPILLIVACDSESTGPEERVPVDMHLTAVLPAAGGSGASTIEITSLRVVVQEAELGNAGGGEIDDDDDGDDDDGAEPGPALVSIPIDGGTVTLATEPVPPGRYAQVELDVVRPTSAVLSASPGWSPDATIEVVGRYGGTPFTLTLPVEGEYQQALNPPVEVPASASGSIAVTIQLPVATWMSANGAPLDPNDPAQRAQIVANARSSFVPDRDDDDDD